MVAYAKLIVGDGGVSGRPFTTKDFVPCFEVGAERHNLSQGMYRKMIYHLRKKGLVEVEFHDYPMAYYTLTGIHHGRQIPSIHRGGLSNKPRTLASLIEGIEFSELAVHDIRLKFSAPNLYSTIRNYHVQESHSRDIVLVDMKQEDYSVKVRVHATDTVTVFVGCSNNPMEASIGGLLRMNEAIVRTEERIANEVGRVMENAGMELPSVTIPPMSSWIVTHWHIGMDSVHEFSGDAINVSWEVASKVYMQVYKKKEIGGRIRIERKGHVAKTFYAAMEDLLNKQMVVAAN